VSKSIPRIIALLFRFSFCVLCALKFYLHPVAFYAKRKNKCCLCCLVANEPSSENILTWQFSLNLLADLNYTQTHVSPILHVYKFKKSVFRKKEIELGIANNNYILIWHMFQAQPKLKNLLASLKDVENCRKQARGSINLWLCSIVLCIVSLQVHSTRTIHTTSPRLFCFYRLIPSWNTNYLEWMGFKQPCRENRDANELRKWVHLFSAIKPTLLMESLHQNNERMSIGKVK